MRSCANSSYPPLKYLDSNCISWPAIIRKARLTKIQQQAFELGQRLQRQQVDLDHRQAEFHAQIARVETELRTARLVCAEREFDLNDKLRQSIAETEFSSSLNVESVERVFRMDPPAVHLVSSPSSVDHSHSKKWDARFAELEQSERQLQAQIAQLDYDRKKLEEHREQLNQRAEQQDSQAELAAAETQRRVRRGSSAVARLVQRTGSSQSFRGSTASRCHANFPRCNRNASLFGRIVQRNWRLHVDHRTDATTCGPAMQADGPISFGGSASRNSTRRNRNANQHADGT